VGSRFFGIQADRAFDSLDADLSLAFRRFATNVLEPMLSASRPSTGPGILGFPARCPLTLTRALDGS
jgi:hypothetical protein